MSLKYEPASEPLHIPSLFSQLWNWCPFLALPLLSLSLALPLSSPPHALLRLFCYPGAAPPGPYTLLTLSGLRTATVDRESSLLTTYWSETT